MKDYQSDKYENFFLNLKVSREGLAAFGEFTATAIGAPGVEALIAGHAADLATAVKGLRDDVVARQGQGGSSQTGTTTENTAFAAFKAFIQASDAKVLRPYLFDHAAEEATYYPAKLGGLTQAPVKQRLTRLTAYTEALEAAADKALKALGTQARALLTQYAAASATKTQARAAVQQTIADLGPAAHALAEALWDVHSAAVYVHRRAPEQARQYFDYASLPGRTATKKPAGTR
ncbi:hypothetical protein [Hymenobacter daeguensis]